MVDRFTVYPGVTYHTGQPHQNIKGEYVLYSDYASLQKELAERTAGQERYKRSAAKHFADSCHLADRALTAEAECERLKKELAERTAERDAALSEVDDLQSQAEVVAEEFEKDCWKAMRSLLSSCNFNWQDVQPDGVTADDAREYISTTLDELEKGEQRWKARADTLARRVEGLEADNERLTKERDRERKHVARLMRDLQHNRERAEKAEAIIRAAPLIQTALTHASFALDGIVALDDEDMGKDGGSATCQQAKHTVDRALAALAAALTGERP